MYLEVEAHEVLVALLPRDRGARAWCHRNLSPMRACVLGFPIDAYYLRPDLVAEVLSAYHQDGGTVRMGSVEYRPRFDGERREVPA